MKPRFSYRLLPAAGLLLAGVLSWGTYSRLRDLETVNRALRERLSALQSGSPTDVRIRRAELLSEGARLEPAGTSALLLNERGDTVRLRDILPDGGIVFRCSRFHCGLCVEVQMRLLEKQAQAMLEPVIIVSDAPTGKQMQVFKQGYKVDREFFALLSPWGLPVEELAEPYYLRLDGDLRVSRVYVPRRDRPEETAAFLGVRRLRSER